jgi:hypothetical protein
VHGVREEKLMARAAFLALLTLAGVAAALAQPAPSPDKSPAPATKTAQRSAAAGGSAVPREDPAAARELFRQLDRNGDGYLTADELWTGRGQEANWAAIDRNGDGRITPDEFTVLHR